MPSVYRPRRPRASPLWQIVHHSWNEFLADYERSHRKAHGPFRPNTLAVVEKFYRCGDLSAGFTAEFAERPDGYPPSMSRLRP